jgi:hypothetical protein
MVCFAATWGFVDGIAVTKFNAAASHACATGEGAGEGHLCDTSVSERLGTVRKEVLNDLFLLGRQISLDVQTAPKVLTGVGYDKWMLGADWNSWLKTASWEEHFPADALSALEASESALSTARMPAVVAPGANNASGLLIRDLNFVLPFGLLVIGLKFLLRTLQVLSGHVVIDLEAAHGDMMSGNTDEHSSDTAKESL